MLEVERDLLAARLAHAARGAHEHATNGEAATPWEELPADLQARLLNAASLRFRNPLMTSEERHSRWYAELRDHGWRYGTLLDPAAKTNPLCLPYNKLPLELRAAEEILDAVVRVLSEEKR